MSISIFIEAKLVLFSFDLVTPLPQIWYSFICADVEDGKILKQAGAELGQAQVKLDAINEVIVEVDVDVEVVKLSSTIILGGWSDKVNLTNLKSS